MNQDILSEMNEFIDSTPEPTKDTEYFEVEEAYARQFGHGVPTEMLPPSASRERIIEAMRVCIEKQKDDLLSILKAKIDPDYKY